MADPTAAPPPSPAPGDREPGGPESPGPEPRGPEPGAPSEKTAAAPYRVLARKYRPASFADLIGQEALVRTLSNAISSGRLAHAFILTGVRGVGKTTTARIIARALNCIGPDGRGGPTDAPCGVCDNCVAIAQDRHVDVIEMDAASRTGIDDIRELIEGVRYRPVSARYKVYIIDEVHMLSRQAFNGLLKTLEEPPEHVVFVFATTEIRKLPVTVLSRCQRFDLRRVEQADLARHFAAIAEKEGVEAPEAALAMIARAADGSVRDGLSLLDQAIALAAGPEGNGKIALDAAQVRDMLGLADRTRVFDLFEAVMRGQVADALAILADMYAAGADPVVVLQDLLELTHFVTRLKLVPSIAEDAAMPEAERARGGDLAAKLAMPALARSWQMLLKGLGEARGAPAPLQAAEMVLIRLAYASELPSPADLVARLGNGESRGAPASPSAPAAAAPNGGPAASAAVAALPAASPPLEGGPLPAAADRAAPSALAAEPVPAESVPAEPQPGLEAAPQDAPQHAPRHAPQPQSWRDLVALVRARREGMLANHLERDVHPVRFEVGRVELRPRDEAPRNLAGQLGRLLEDWTGERWVVSVSSEAGEATLHEQRQAERAQQREAALRDPLVQAVLETFPDAELTALRDAAPGDDTTDADTRGTPGDAPGDVPGDTPGDALGLQGEGKR